MRHDEYGQVWYYEDKGLCGFAIELLDELTRQRFIRWDSYIQENGRWYRTEGVWSVRLDDKGLEMLQRVEQAQADR